MKVAVQRYSGGWDEEEARKREIRKTFKTFDPCEVDSSKCDCDSYFAFFTVITLGSPPIAGTPNKDQEAPTRKHKTSFAKRDMLLVAQLALLLASDLGARLGLLRRKSTSSRFRLRRASCEARTVVSHSSRRQYN